MEAPRELRSAVEAREDVTVAHRDYDGETLLVVDFGPEVEVSAAVVNGRVIVVAGDQQIEFDVPSEAAAVSANGGMLLIRQ